MNYVHAEPALAISFFEAQRFHEALALAQTIAGHVAIHVKGIHAKRAVVAVTAAQRRDQSSAFFAGKAFVFGNEMFSGRRNGFFHKFSIALYKVGANGRELTYLRK